MPFGSSNRQMKLIAIAPQYRVFVEELIGYLP
jgi:hypothetical protein